MRFSLLPWLGKSRHERLAERFAPVAANISALESEMKALTDEQLKERVVQYKGLPLSELSKSVTEIFAAVREAARRTLKMRHFDAQLIGGLALLEGKIAEMKTGEGKTLVATLPLVLHGLGGKGAHLVTVNDYLAKRDAEWMRPVYAFFDLSVGVVIAGMNPDEKRAAYNADITYGTNNEFGFDYLRDNMAENPQDFVQRGLSYAIVDEVDSILIDEARTPLIISAPDADSTRQYQQFARLVPQLQEGTHYNIDEKRRAVSLTDEGISRIENLLGVQNIYEQGGVRLVHHLEQALRAETLYHRDKEYVVQNGEVIIVDEFTGRLMQGRRYSEGLHQAIEAKEGVKVQQESRTLATITFQNLFRLYERLAGMTGTAVTSAEEFEKVYNLEVAVIPTNKPLIRTDRPDRIFMNEAAKFRAVVAEIKQRYEKGQPVLVGTIAIEKSEYLSTLLQKEGITHQVLNAKHHAREADIVARAGQQSAVTISTNMAGRGTDIKLGEDVAERGGLFVLGTERHEARRIDNQLRGRSGRQGDPGETQFFVSMEDDVMRIFGGDRIRNLMQRLKVPEDQPIENRLVSRALEGAQERVEGHYFDMRKQVLGYDDILNRQRNAIYSVRRSILLKGVWKESGQPEVPLHDKIQEFIQEQAESLVRLHTAAELIDEWNSEEIAENVHALTGRELASLHALFKDAKVQDSLETARTVLTDTVTKVLLERYQARQQELGGDTFSALQRAASIRAIDTFWMEHLDTMDYLRTGIGLRGYGQRDPLVEYQREGHQLFISLLSAIKGAIVTTVFRAETVRSDAPAAEAHHDSAIAPHSHAAQRDTATNPYKNIGRNDPCPCGSGKKYKKCGLLNSEEHQKRLVTA